MRRPVPNHLWFFKQILYEVKTKFFAAYFLSLLVVFNVANNKTKIYKTLEY